MSASALYFGQVVHRRHHPHPHAFRYPIAQLLLDLDELDQVFAGRWLWSVAAWSRTASASGVLGSPR